ncbi:hypothetical protein [Pirellulimonas nuda]|uniref:hypothetical protein n=1 Tax=Pirellulimonas nuda TaxID=2528009 RepID=UPI0018D2E9D1|nr:hypothetical protein [Pirellulimonas nuda]
MSKKDKTLCDWTKHDIRDRAEELYAIVRSPKYVCLKCARSACDKKHLCKPTELPKK